MSVDTKRLRDLLKAHADFSSAMRVSINSGGDTVAAVIALDEANHTLDREAGDALPALLDELDAARALLREVAEHGLASFDPVRQRVDLTRRIAAFLEP